MSSGTLVKLERYFNRYHFQTLGQLDGEIQAARARVAESVSALSALALATPKDITPKEEEPYDYVMRKFKEVFEEYKEADYHLCALLDIKDGWETKEED